MTEREGGFIPENPNEEHDMSQAYLSADSISEFFDALAGFKDTDKIVLDIPGERIDPAGIKRLIEKFPLTHITVRCSDDEERGMVRAMLPWPSSVEVL